MKFDLNDKWTDQGKWGGNTVLRQDTGSDLFSEKPRLHCGEHIGGGRGGVEWMWDKTVDTVQKEVNHAQVDVLSFQTSVHPSVGGQVGRSFLDFTVADDEGPGLCGPKWSRLSWIPETRCLQEKDCVDQWEWI